jgi:hypothetical protein
MIAFLLLGIRLETGNNKTMYVPNCSLEHCRFASLFFGVSYNWLIWHLLLPSKCFLKIYHNNFNQSSTKNVMLNDTV